MNRAISAQFWRAKDLGLEPHVVISRTLDGADASWSVRRKIAMRNAELAGVDLTAFGIDTTSTQLEHEIISFNVALNVASTIAGKVSLHKVVPFAAPDGAKASLQRKAAKFNTAISGLFQDLGVYEQDHQWVMDALTWEAAVAKVTTWDDEVVVERCYPFDLYVDPIEARYGWRGVRTLYQVHAIDRQRLVSRFKHLGPDIVDAIEANVLDEHEKQTFNFGADVDMVTVTEAWHLPSGRKAKDGRYVLALRNVTLVDEPYTKDSFPFAFFYEERPRAGIWQLPLLSRLASAQREYDLNRATLQEAMPLAVPILAVRKGDNVAKSQMSDELGQVIEYLDAPPQYLTPQPIHPDVVNYMNSIPQDMLRFSGVNEMAAQGQVPRGLAQASGKALQVFADEGTERLAPMMDNRQRFYVDIGELIIEACRDLVKDGKKVITTLYNGKSVQIVDFSDIDLGEGKYKLQVQPTSMVAKNPATKYQQLSEMRAQGDITPIEFRKLLGVPDLQAANEYETAPLVNAERIVEQIIDAGIIPAILPTNSKDMLIDRTSKAIELAQINGEDSQTIELLHEFLLRLTEQDPEPEGGAMPPPGPPPPMPPGPEAMPPMPGVPPPGVA